LIADVGSIGGGWLSSTFIKHGWTINRARKTAMLICALAVTPIVLAANVKNLWVAVGLIGLAAAAHQGWSCNLFTTTSDMFPRQAVGSVVGLGGMAGALGGATLAVATGYILESTGQNYTIVFFIAGSAYLVALLVIHLLAPQLRPVEDIEDGLWAGVRDCYREWRVRRFSSTSSSAPQSVFGSVSSAATLFVPN
jgi:ACS family hexuronate transporter-like MFS transporter